jgi:hypothetical protein
MNAFRRAHDRIASGPVPPPAPAPAEAGAAEPVLQSIELDPPMTPAAAPTVPPRLPAAPPAPRTESSPEVTASPAPAPRWTGWAIIAASLAAAAAGVTLGLGSRRVAWQPPGSGND